MEIGITLAVAEIIMFTFLFMYQNHRFLKREVRGLEKRLKNVENECRELEFKSWKENLDKSLDK